MPRRDGAPLRIGSQSWTAHELATQLGVVHVAAARRLSAALAVEGYTSLADVYRRSSPETFSRTVGLGDTCLFVLWRAFQAAGLDPDAWAARAVDADAIVSFRSLKIRAHRVDVTRRRAS
jgi:hypothetical protein